MSDERQEIGMTSTVLETWSDHVADELYGLTPDQFCAVRDARAAQARRAGDAVTAAAIARMPKPSVAAWMTNQLVRRCYDQTCELLQIGRQLRAATEQCDGEALRELGARRRRAEAELRRQARSVAYEQGVRVDHRSLVAFSATLQAAMCRDDLTQLLLAGRLSQAWPRLSWPDLGAGYPHVPVSNVAGGPWPRREFAARLPRVSGDTDVAPLRFPGDAGDELGRRRALRRARSLQST